MQYIFSRVVVGVNKEGEAINVFFLSIYFALSFISPVSILAGVLCDRERAFDLTYLCPSILSSTVL